MGTKYRMPSEFVVGQLISLAPPGKEVLQIAKDCNSLTHGECESKVIKLIRNFYEQHAIRIDKNFRITKYNQLELEDDQNTAASPQCYYANPLTGEVILVDYRSVHLGTLQVNKVNELFDLASGNEFLSLIKDSLLKLSSEDRELFSAVYETDQPNACILVTGLTEYMEVNFWSIHCNCVWTVSRDPETNKLGYSGDISISVHYYEAGANFQFKIDHLKIKKRGEINNFEKLFSKIKLSIFKIKSRIHEKFFLLDSFDDNGAIGGQGGTSAVSSSSSASSLSSTSPPVRSTPPASAIATAAFSPIPVTILKKLRRQLPIQKTKFDWNLHKALLIQNLS